MSDTITAGNPETSTAGTLNGTSTEVVEGTGTQNGEARQGATGTETFIPEGIDLNTLPPNVRAYVDKINKDMVRGFTEKTSKLSETIKSESQKAAEAYRQKAEQYDQIATQEEFVKMWNEHVQKVQSGTQEPGDPKVAQLEAKFQEIQQKIQLAELSEITDSFKDAVDEKGNLLHPEFEELNKLDIGLLNGGKEPFSLLRGCVELAPGKTEQERLANGYKQAKSVYDSIFEAGKKAGMGRIQAKAQNGTLPPSNASGDVMSVTEKRPKTAREALEMAKRGQVVSRD